MTAKTKTRKKRTKAAELARELQQLRDLDKCMADFQTMRTVALEKIFRLIAPYK